MSLLPTGTSARISYPRHWIVVGGAHIPLTRSTVTRKSTRNADTFSASFPVNAAAKVGFGLGAWVDWDQSQDVSLVYATAPGSSDVRTMISGRIDRPEVRLETMTVTVRSRDKSASLTERKRSETFKNQRSSDIVAKIARDHGLTPAVVQTGDFAGKLLKQDVAHLVQNRTDYEVLSLLADREGFRWYVEADTLYFEPKEQVTDVWPIHFVPPGITGNDAVSNCTSLTFSGNTAAARPHKVTVRSWHHQHKKTYQYSASSGGVGELAEYVHHHNGKTLSQVTALAKSRLKDRVRHELTITAEMPADLSVTPRMKTRLTGTGTSLDQLYDIDSIEYQMGWDEPFTMTITARAPKQGRTVDE